MWFGILKALELGEQQTNHMQWTIKIKQMLWCHMILTTDPEELQRQRLWL
jgi:hypothetical protein